MIVHVVAGLHVELSPSHAQGISLSTSPAALTSAARGGVHDCARNKSKTKAGEENTKQPPEKDVDKEAQKGKRRITT